LGDAVGSTMSAFTSYAMAINSVSSLGDTLFSKETSAA